jgi:cell division protein FtsN
MQVRLELAAATVAGAGAPAETAPPIDMGTFAVQVGLFNDKNKAEKLKANLEKRYRPIDLVPREGERTQWRVVVGNVPTQTEAQALALVLKQKAGEAEVVRRDLP